MSTDPSVSIVIPTYNAERKLPSTIASLQSFLGHDQYEIVLVDDCSSDGTIDIARNLADRFTNVVSVALPINSGSASAPRNAGLEIANGKYVFFLDADDPINAEGFAKALDLAEAAESDIVRSPIEVRRRGGESSVVDDVSNWDSEMGMAERVTAIVKHQGLTVSCLFRRSLLVDSGINFDPTRRIGEDIIFTARAMAMAGAIEYSETPMRAYVRDSSGGESVTQGLSSRDFGEFFSSWHDVEMSLSALGVSFLELHGAAAIGYCLRQFLWFRKEPLSSRDFAIASGFVRSNWSVIGSYRMNSRLLALLRCLHGGDLAEFNDASKLRVVFAGHDLKFLRGLSETIGKTFAVEFDEWEGHSSHNPLHSEAMLNWADVVYAEWLLGSAVWYSERIRSFQRLVVRCHRSEVNADYGNKIRDDRVSRYIAVSGHVLDDFSDRFDIRREKFSLVPNAVEIGSFQKRPPERTSVSRLLMVGSVPRLKGLLRAIELLAKLREVSDEFVLTVVGRSPDELSWVWNDKDEREYFDLCKTRIEYLGLSDSVSFVGWSDLKSEYANHDVLLSLSDFEGFHLAPLEAMAADVVPVIRSWRAATECHPSLLVAPNDEDVFQRILTLRSPAAYREAVAIGRQNVRSFDVAEISERTVKVLRECGA